LRVIRPILYGILLWIVAIYAFRRGGADEKIVAIAFVAGSYLAPLVVFTVSFTHFHSVEIPLAMVDIAFGVFLLGVALRSSRYWPLWLTAMQGLTILSHFAPLVPHMIPWNSRNAVVIWSWPMLVTLGLAVRRRHREQAAGQSGESVPIR
jgi:hypothetical protein